MAKTAVPRVAPAPPPSVRKRPLGARAASGSGNVVTNFLYVFQAAPMERVDMVKRGVPATEVEIIAKRMAVSKENLLSTLGLPRATVDRKARQNKALTADESSRVVGMAQLVGQVQAMIEESGSPEGFNAAEWVARWLERPLPALSGKRPAELMDTHEGQEIVSRLIARMQSGAYA